MKRRWKSPSDLSDPTDGPPSSKRKMKKIVLLEFKRTKDGKWKWFRWLWDRGRSENRNGWRPSRSLPGMGRTMERGSTVNSSTTWPVFYTSGKTQTLYDVDVKICTMGLTVCKNFKEVSVFWYFFQDSVRQTMIQGSVTQCHRRDRQSPSWRYHTYLGE